MMWLLPKVTESHGLHHNLFHNTELRSEVRYRLRRAQTLVKRLGLGTTE